MINPVQLKADVAVTLGPHGESPGSTYKADTSQILGELCHESGFLGANMAACVFNPDQIEEVKTHWQLYKNKQRPILRGSKVGDMPADVYHILPPPDGINWDGIEFFNTSLNKGSVILLNLWRRHPIPWQLFLKVLTEMKLI